MFKANNCKNYNLFSNCSRKRAGFIATIAVAVLSALSIAFSLASLASAVSFSDYIYRRELRTQANLNATSCLEMITLMVTKDYFLSGQIEIREFGCIADVTNDQNGAVSFVVEARLGAVSAILSREILIQDFMLNVI